MAMGSRLRCAGCGVEANCDCDVGYITAGEYARRAVEKYPEKSNRAIAAEIGVAYSTVRRTRNSTAAFAAVASSPNGEVEKRVGADGKTRKMPKKPTSPKTTEVLDRMVATHAASGKAPTAAELKKEGVSNIVAQKAVFAFERDQEFEAAVTERVKADTAELEQRVRDMEKSYNERLDFLHKKEQEAFYTTRAFRRGIFTKEEYRKIWSCLHPDRVQDEQLKRLFGEAFNLFSKVEIWVTSEKDNPQAPPIPQTIQELMKHREAVEAKRKAERDIKRAAAASDAKRSATSETQH